MNANISLFDLNTWVNVVRCLLLAGVGHEAVVGVCPACWGNEETPLPGEDTPPETDESPLFGSGFSFLNAPSAILIGNRVSGQCCCCCYSAAILNANSISYFILQYRLYKLKVLLHIVNHLTEDEVDINSIYIRGNFISSKILLQATNFAFSLNDFVNSYRIYV